MKALEMGIQEDKILCEHDGIQLVQCGPESLPRLFDAMLACYAKAFRKPHLTDPKIRDQFVEVEKKFWDQSIALIWETQEKVVATIRIAQHVPDGPKLPTENAFGLDLQNIPDNPENILHLGRFFYDIKTDGLESIILQNFAKLCQQFYKQDPNTAVIAEFYPRMRKIFAVLGITFEDWHEPLEEPTLKRDFDIVHTTTRRLHEQLQPPTSNVNKTKWPRRKYTRKKAS